jgi:transposase-like protein
MSVIVKGMELPKVCTECPFSQRAEDGEYLREDSGFRCLACNKRLDENKDGRHSWPHRRADFCPLEFVMGV